MLYTENAIATIVLVSTMRNYVKQHEYTISDVKFRLYTSQLNMK